jgi:hypothetical protein
LYYSCFFDVFKIRIADATLLCECLGKDWNENWCTWSYEESINTLFWKNILVNSNGKYAWRDEATKEMAKEVFGC